MLYPELPKEGGNEEEIWVRIECYFHENKYKFRN